MEGYIIDSFGEWSNPDGTRIGICYRMAKPEAEKDRYFVVYNKCNGIMAELPFGIYDMETNILYLDNAPTDGVIDDVVSSPESLIYEDAPDCKE